MGQRVEAASHKVNSDGKTTSPFNLVGFIIAIRTVKEAVGIEVNE
jgi:hypothetical protein